MTFNFQRDPISNDLMIRIVISDWDMLRIYGKLDGMDRHCVDEWGRIDSSIEEKLMLLQLYARKLEEVEHE